MTVFAARRGWEIAEMFVAGDPHHLYLAFAQLLAACRTRHPVAVLLDRVRREAGIPVLVATAPVLAGGRCG
jgi:hypothetical protein